MTVIELNRTVGVGRFLNLVSRRHYRNVKRYEKRKRRETWPAEFQ